jgi:cell wall-associated NlpC family hydrolase
MAGQGGIPGGAVAMASAGAFLLYVGIGGQSIRDGLKSIAAGQLPPPRTGGAQNVQKAQVSLQAQGVPATGATATAGAGPHPELAKAALAYVGIPYQWGGTSRTSGLDCSGLVYVAFQDAEGVTPPRTTYTLIAWKQITPITRADVGAGDLLFWPRIGPPSHVGIAVDGSTVVHAPRPGKSVEVVPISAAFTGGMQPTPYRWKG